MSDLMDHTTALHRGGGEKQANVIYVETLKIPDESPVKSNNRAGLAVNGRY